MKKLLALLVTLTFVLTLAACGTDDDTEFDNTGTLRVGMDLSYPPFETRDTNGDPEGISVDVAYELGEYLDRDVEIVNLPFSSLIPALNAGDIDIIVASMSVTEERENSIDFTNPYFYFPIITLLNKDFQETNDIYSEAALFAHEGVVFTAPASFVTLDIARDRANNPVIQPAQDTTLAVREIANGLADAFMMSPSSVVDANNANPNTTSILWDIIDDSPIAMGVKEGNTELLEDANAFIAGMEANGVYDRLRTKYNAIIGERLPGQTLDFYIRDNEED